MSYFTDLASSNVFLRPSSPPPLVPVNSESDRESVIRLRGTNKSARFRPYTPVKFARTPCIASKFSRVQNRERENTHELVGTKLNWLWHTLREPRVFILEREWTTRASASIAEIFASLSMRVNSRMSVCLCKRGARIHASPRPSHRADIRHETPVRPTLWACRRCVFRDHYNIPHLLLLVKDLKDSDWERFLPIPTLTQSTKE